MAAMEREIVDNRERHRFELVLDGRVSGHVHYRLDGDVLVVPHVEVVPELRGTGTSGPFLDDVLALIRARGHKVRPLCGYASSRMHADPSLHDLLA